MYWREGGDRRHSRITKLTMATAKEEYPSNRSTQMGNSRVVILVVDCIRVAMGKEKNGESGEKEEEERGKRRKYQSRGYLSEKAI